MRVSSLEKQDDNWLNSCDYTSGREEGAGRGLGGGNTLYGLYRYVRPQDYSVFSDVLLMTRVSILALLVIYK